MPKALGTPHELDGDQDSNVIVSAAALMAARALSVVPPLAVVVGAAGAVLKGYAGYLCHKTDRLLYGFLVKENWHGGFEENLLKEPPIFPL
ncbi:MAG: hypothetical protein FWH27_04405 [Planctomycetaceae bacterium]|nr:hypothetical protein [Planctomycetaceae bacterium]